MSNKSIKFKNALAIFALTIGLANNLPVFSQTAQPDANSAAAAAPATTAPSEKDQDTACEKQLKTMGESVSRLRRAAIDLYSECTQQMEMMGEIDFIGSEVIPIMPVTAEGFGPAQYLPPRKKYVDLHMNQIIQLSAILQDEISTLNIPDNEKSNAAQMMAGLQGEMQLIQDHLAQLKQLTPGPKYQNAPIAAESRAIHDSCDKINSLRKDLYHLMKKDLKS